MAPVAISLPVACDTDDKNVNKSVSQNVSYFQLFDCEKKYTGLLNMFTQLVINNVDTDAKRKAVDVFVKGVDRICNENDKQLQVAQDVKQNISFSIFRYIVIRPDDAMDSSMIGIKVWYMVSESAFATPKAFLEMSSDRPTPVKRYQDLMRNLTQAMKNGNAVQVMAILDANPALTKADVFCAFGYPNGRVWGAVVDGHVDLLKYLTSEFKLSKEEVCGSECQFVCRAFIDGHLEMVKMLCLLFDLTKEEVFGANNHGLYGAALHGHLEAIQWVVKHFKLA